MNATEPLLFIEDFEELFVDVQVQRIFEDQKFFTDCVPKFSTKEILDSYRIDKKKKGFKLFEFCKTNFQFPASAATGFVSDASKTIEEHINILWDVLTKQTEEKSGTQIMLPHQFVVPGGRFREVYYWDSYFTMLGLQVSRKIDLIENMVNNFAYLIDNYGFIPNGNRSYFLSRSQPPFFSLMVELLTEEKGNDVLIKYLPQLEKEYQFWMKGEDAINKNNNKEGRVVAMKDGEILNRYWDNLDTPRAEAYADDLITAQEIKSNRKDIFRHIRAAAESGWDFSSRWFRDENDMSTIYTTDIIPLDLNCLMFCLEKTIAKAFELANQKMVSEKYAHRAMRRLNAIHKYLWDEKGKIFVDYDLINNKPTGRVTAVVLYPLFLSIATNTQSIYVTKQLKSNFLKAGGLVTTLSFNGQQWDAPNGWAPIQWAGFRGAINYGSEELAKKIKACWISSVDNLFKRTGKITEKYNVVETGIGATGGEYPNQDGFGWTNGVYLKLMDFI
jgi:alpha,alpha-trehalase